MEAKMEVDKYLEDDDTFEAFLGSVAKESLVLMFSRLLIAWAMGEL